MTIINNWLWKYISVIHKDISSIKINQLLNEIITLIEKLR